ncbi:hypothetical protein IMZ48_34835 [Candidatus Bathyarchaeota archaeon]|nr:hypothetical protein [Candidatus Bathyarchaeota archaeon]
MPQYKGYFWVVTRAANAQVKVKHWFTQAGNTRGAEPAGAAVILTYFEESAAAGRVEWDLECARASRLATDALGMHRGAEGDPIDEGKPEEP